MSRGYILLVDVKLNGYDVSENKIQKIWGKPADYFIIEKCKI